MISRREFSSFSSALSSLCFADNLVAAVGQVQKSGSLRTQDVGLLETADSFFTNVITGYKWSDRPDISSTSVQSATAFAEALSAIAPGLRAEQPAEFIDYIRLLQDTARRLAKERTAQPERVKELQDFFTAYGYVQLERTNDIINRTGRQEASSWPVGSL